MSFTIKALLTKVNNVRKEKLQHNEWFKLEEAERYESEYNKIVLKGYKQNKKTKSKYAKSDEIALLNRLKNYKENHLLFMHDNRVSFDNNMSERDLRKCKNRQKMAGGFRTYKGQEMYCRIISVTETIKRKKLCIFQTVHRIISRGLVSI